MPNANELERQRQEEEMRKMSGNLGREAPDMVLIPTEKEAEAQRRQDDDDFDNGRQMGTGPSDFEKELEMLLNRYSMENASNTPDFILARYLRMSLDVFSKTVTRREHWHGRD